MNYIKQTDSYSCGPVAIMNALIFQERIDIENNDLLKQTIFKKWTSKLNCKPPNGTKVKRFWQIAKLLRFNRVYNPTLDKLHEILDRGDAVILNHGDKKRRHYSLIIDRTNVSYGIVNHYCGPTLNPVHKSTFLKDVWLTPKLWLVTNPKKLKAWP